MSGRRSSYRDDEIPTLYVRQVHYSARPDDLRALFERMGPVRDVYIPLDYYTRESRGFAYVKFEFTRDAEDALRELNGASILGRRIEVEWAEGQRKTKTEMRARDSYGSYRVRSRYRSRSPYKSGRDRSPRRRSPSRYRSSSRSRSHSHSRSRRWSHNSRRHRSSSRHHQGSTRSRNSRSTRSSSVSVKKNREKDRQMKRSKSPHVPGSLHSSLDESNQSDEEHDIVNVQHIQNRKSTEDLKESVIDELEMRSEARASDIENDEKQIQKAAQKNESANYLEDHDDHVGMEIEGSSTSTTEEEEGDKGAADIEVIDEIVEQNSIVFNGAAVEDACPVDSINVQELLMTDTAG